MGFPHGASGKESSSQCDVRDASSIPWWRFFPKSGRSPGAVSGNPLQYSCLENYMASAAWLSQTRLSTIWIVVSIGWKR